MTLPNQLSLFQPQDAYSMEANQKIRPKYRRDPQPHRYCGGCLRVLADSNKTGYCSNACSDLRGPRTSIADIDTAFQELGRNCR